MKRSIGDRWQRVRDFVHERLWLCEVKGIHREKFSSEGRCIRCQRQIRDPR